MKRRRLLVANGMACLSLGLAGCVQDYTTATGNTESKNEDAPETSSDNRPPVSKQPRNIHLSNSYKQGRVLTVDVEFGEELIHDEKYKLSSGSLKVIEGIADEIGGYTITVGLEDGRKMRDTWSVNNDSTAALVELTQNDELRFVFNPDM